MMKKVLFLIVLLSTMNSCDRPDCENQNPIFDEYAMDSNEYKLELWKQINIIGQDELRYWFDKYVMEAKNEFLIVNIQNDDLCAKGKILVKDWGRFRGLKTKKKGYGGAELKGFRFKLEENQDHFEFVFQDLDEIWD